MATAAQKFQSDEEAMAFLMGGAVVDAQLDVAPAPEFAPPDVETPLPGVIEPNVQAVMEANGEPPLPVKEDETLPPVQPAGFATDEEALAFLQAGNVPADPEAKMLDIELPKKAPTAPPVTTPEAADGTDVTFKEGDVPFKYTGRLVMVPGTGPTAGLEGMQPGVADGPVAPENLSGTNQAVFNRRPQLVPDGGQIVFDQSSPERFTEGVERAFESGLLPQANYEKIKAKTAEIFKVVEERRKLEAKAQQDPKLLAALQGFGRGGAMTLGAVGGAKGGAALGLLAGPAAPIAVPVLAAVGGIGGGIAAGAGYDALYKQLGKHFEEYDNVMKAAELYPQYAQGGELTMAAVALPVSVAQGARGLTTAYQAGGLPAAARMAGTASAAGAGTGVVAYPIDAAVRGDEITPGGLATAAATGAAMGGFFINNRMATQKDLAAVAAKMKAGMKLSAAETELARAAGPAVRAEIARMDAAGGVRSGPMEVRVPVTSVAGLMPAAGRATARLPFTVPARLPAGARARAEAVAAARPAGSRTAGPAVPTETMAPVPRSAPTTVLPRGDVPIPMPGPLVPATMGIEAYLAKRAKELGLTRENVNEIFALQEEHKALVVEAIDRNEPVTAEALRDYGIDVPYYEVDEATGLATFNPETFKAWSDYLGGRDAEAAENVRADGVELIDAIRDLGGLPSPKSGRRKAVWSGELKTLWETSRGGRDIGIKGVMNLWRNDAKDLDDIVQGLRQRGFRLETESDLIEMLDNRIRTGRPTYGYGAISEEWMPGVLRGKAQQMDLLGEDAVEFTLQGQTDRTSLTPEEMRLRDLEAQRAQEAEKLQGDLFGGVRGSDRAPSITEDIPLGMNRPTPVESQLEALSEDIFYAERAQRTKDLDAIERFLDDQVNSEQLLADPAFRTQLAAAQDKYAAAELEHYRRVQTQVASSELFVEMFNLSEGFDRPEWLASEAGQKFKIITKIIGSRPSESRTDAALLESLTSLPARIKEDPNWQEVTDWKMRRTKQALQKVLDEQTGGGVQPDPLTPPVQQRAGSAGPEVRRGTAMPGPGVARTTTTPRPDWVLQPGETSEGRRIIKGIENFKRGQKWGMRSIIDHVNRAVKLEMRRSTSQTTRKHPANYRPKNHVAFTRNTQSQINFHEAGHGLYELVEARVPGFWQRFEAELMPLTTREGSMASADNLHEAVAEWLRLLLVDPPAVANMKVTTELSAAADQFYPKMAAQLRDAARAVHRFQNKPAAEKWAMFNADPTQQPPTFGDFVQRAILGGRAVTNFLSSGAPVARMDRGIFRQIMKDRAEVDLGWRDALKLAREVRAETKAIQDAYNMVLNIGAETTSAISGTGPMKGVRYMGPDGKYVRLTKESWRDLRLKVPTTKLRQFDEAAWAKESLSRYEYFTARAMAARDAGDEAGMRKALQQRQYPGMMEGLTPEDLRGIVTTARQEIPRFEEYFREQSAFFDAVLNVKEFGGLKKPGEVSAMMDARDTYWPLPKVMSSSRAPRTGRTSRGDIQAGDRGIQGSGEPIRNVDEVAEERVRQAYDAFYWNRFGLTMVDRMAKVAADDRLPAEVRAMAGRETVKLIIPSEKVATLSAEEVVPWVLDAVAAKMEEVLGYKPELTPDDVRLSWNFKDVFRPAKPNDVDVVSLLRNGEREFVQLGDRAVFSMIAAPQNVSRLTGLIKWALGPSLENWKRNITQSLPFAFANMWGDMFNQTMLNPERIGWFPLGATGLGIINKFTKKYPQVFQDGLLLSRVEPSRTELVNQVRHNAVWQWASEGFYVSTSKDPVTRVLQTALQPSNWLFPLWKTGDVINLMLPGAAVGAVVGGPVGAAVGSLVGPALGFTGANIAAFTETSTREGAAVDVLLRGGTDEQAINAYWGSVGRFNEHAGNADVRAMMAMPGFFNPMVQAFRGAMTNLTDPDPAVSGKSWAKLLMMYPAIFGGAAIMRYLMMNEDEKERERERTLEDRLGYYDIGGMRIRFPYGPEGAMSSLTYNAVMDDLLGRPAREAERGAKLLLKRIIDPTAGPLQFLGPQLSTLTEASMNWSGFRQKHIVAPWMTSLPASEQYYATTPQFYRELGTMLNYSPIKLQYVVTQGISRQVDETIRLMESIDGGRPIREDADVPFVGRMFVRNPTGMASQSVKEAGDVEDRLRKLDSRLKAKGWNMLRDPNFPAEKIGDRQLVQLQTQLQYLEVLRGGLRRMQDVAALSKYYTLKEDWANEANARALMTRYAQSVLVGNTDQIRVLDEAIKLLKQIPQASPEQVAEEYRQRRF